MEPASRQPEVLTRAAAWLCLLCASFAAAAADGRNELQILGYVERVALLDPQMMLEAKLDTGAETSSLHADVLKSFRRGGQRWVRFRIHDPATGQSHIIVRERVRTVAVIQHDGERQKRPVVLMTICIAGRVVETEVSLIDRSEFAYPLLLGRNTLARIALVDPAASHLSAVDCAVGGAALGAGR